jgi:DNA-binding beta-propeller fold protein YncE
MLNMFIMALGALLAANNLSGQEGELLVVNQSNATISLVNPDTFAVEGTIEEKLPGKVHVHEAAVTLDGKTALLPVYGDAGVGKPGTDGHEVLFADLSSGTITGSVDFGRGVRPHLPVVDPNTGLVYVTTELDRSIAVIDPASRSIIGRVPTGADQSHMLVLSHDGTRGYTANVGPGSVSVLDMKARKTLTVIQVAPSVQRISISADDRLVFTSDATSPRLAVIDTSTRQVREWIKLPGLGYGSATTKDGRWLLVAMPKLDAVALIDLKTMKVSRTFEVGTAPQEILVRPDGRVAYVSCAGSGSVSVIDLSKWLVSQSFPTAAGADGLAWASH